MLRDHDLGRQAESVQIMLNEYLDLWLETAAKPKLRAKSYESYESLLRRYIRPVLGGRILSTITPLDVQAACQRMTERGLSARTTRYAYSVLRSAMRQAIRWRLMIQDPTDGAQLPRLGRREMRVLTAEQSRIFLSAVLKTHCGPVFAIALTTGMRPGEVPRLEVAGHQLEARHREHRTDARESEWRLAFRGDKTSAQPAHDQVAGLGAGSAESSAHQD